MKKTLLILILPMLFFACSSKKKDNTSELKEETIPEIAETNMQPSEDNQPGNSATPSNKISFYFTPSVDEMIVRENGKLLLNFLEKETQLKYSLHVPKDYAAMIEDFGAGKADVGIMNSLSYVKAHEKYGVTAKLRAVRYGKSVYFGQIITKADNGITDVNDLQGKTMAFTDPSSTSGYLFPQNILNKAGIKPSKSIFAGKHDEVVRLVYHGSVDGGATFYSEPAADGSIRDARARLIDQLPDVEEKVKIIAITDPIPNDPVVFSKDLPSDVAFKISLGLIKFVATPEGKAVLQAIYSTEGFVRCSDADYDNLRAALN